ncbi:hypothetical protein ACFLRW_00800 [Acidobacteriota bacterium]
MKKIHFLSIVILILAANLFQPLHPQESQKSKTTFPRFEEYQFVARGKMSSDRGLRPNQIVGMDNNGELLLACIEPQTTGQLRSRGITFFQSQLELLIDWNLLIFKDKDNTYKTTIYIYSPEKAKAIRSHVHNSILQLASKLHTDLLSLKDSLEKTHHEKSLFSILYAYILHDYSMRQFGPDIYQKPLLSEKFPFWNGFSWAVYPIKRYDIGVTALPAKDSKFFFVSSNAVPGPNFQQILSFVKDVSTDHKVDDPENRINLSNYGVCDEYGELTVPVFKEEWTTILENMAKKVYVQTIQMATSTEMKDILGMTTQAQAAMFLHYEIRFAFLNHLLEKGFIEAPLDFENSKNNRSTVGRNLVFVIKVLPEQ